MKKSPSRSVAIVPRFNVPRPRADEAPEDSEQHQRPQHRGRTQHAGEHHRAAFHPSRELNLPPQRPLSELLAAPRPTARCPPRSVQPRVVPHREGREVFKLVSSPSISAVGVLERSLPPRTPGRSSLAFTFTNGIVALSPRRPRTFGAASGHSRPGVVSQRSNELPAARSYCPARSHVHQPEHVRGEPQREPSAHPACGPR